MNKIVARLSPVDQYGCREVALQVHYGGHVSEAGWYEAGKLYLKSEDAEMILRTLGGHSFGFVGEVELRHVGASERTVVAERLGPDARPSSEVR